MQENGRVLEWKATLDPFFGPLSLVCTFRFCAARRRAEYYFKQVFFALLVVAMAINIIIVAENFTEEGQGNLVKV